ncbi:MAG TPA: glutaredoxin [Gammaproteobacteria bacterium]|nr:glutaredoxin [Gammaproteobacteria bacterium]
MKIIRWMLGRVILLLELLTTPKGVIRNEVAQEKLDEITQKYSLYQFKACPFCVKVRKIIHKNSLSIEYRDAKNDQEYRNELATGGGKVKVPCLRILDEKGEDKWIYESNAIIAHLEEVAAIA